MRAAVFITAALSCLSVSMAMAAQQYHLDNLTRGECEYLKGVLAQRPINEAVNLYMKVYAQCQTQEQAEDAPPAPVKPEEKKPDEAPAP